MFERFAKEAKGCVVAAQQVARDASSRRIDTRHLLVPLLDTPGATAALRAVGADADLVASRAAAAVRSDGLDPDALAALGIDLEAVRREADATFGPGALDRAGRSPGGHIPFTPEAKKALEMALREAIRLQQRTIGSSHLLLGILRGESLGRTLLVESGVDTGELRSALEAGTRAPRVAP